MSVPYLAAIIVASALVGWHARDRIAAGPGMDDTVARRLARRIWKRRRKG